MKMGSIVRVKAKVGDPGDKAFAHFNVVICTQHNCQVPKTFIK